jgi:hypothetical protein
VTVDNSTPQIDTHAQLTNTAAAFVTTGGAELTDHETRIVALAAKALTRGAKGETGKDGETGPVGPRGPAGAASNIPGPPGTNGTNGLGVPSTAGHTEHQVLALGAALVPEWSTAGGSGNMLYRGQWAYSTLYHVDDVVVWFSAMYVCAVEHTSEADPGLIPGSPDLTKFTALSDGGAGAAAGSLDAFYNQPVGYWSGLQLPPVYTRAGSVSMQATKGTIYFMPHLVTSTKTYTKIGFQTAASSTGSGVTRLGIYRSDPTCELGINGLVLDAGTVNASAGNTAYSITINVTLTPGLYWLAISTGNGASTNCVGMPVLGLSVLKNANLVTNIGATGLPYLPCQAAFDNGVAGTAGSAAATFTDDPIGTRTVGYAAWVTAGYTVAAIARQLPTPNGWTPLGTSLFNTPCVQLYRSA